MKVSQESPKKRPDGTFRILSIDGGGFRGVYSAHLLKRMEDEFDVNWQRDFDLIAGASTGSIIAACLALGKSADDVLALYKNNGRKIFYRRPWPRMGLFASKFSHHHLKRSLEDIFKKTTLGDINKPLIIPTTDIANGCVHVLKSSFHGDFTRDKNVLVVNAILASCSAPTYFPPTLLPGSQPYLLADGGLWANNPSLAATIDAKRRLNARLDDIRVLSVGTGTANRFYPIKGFKQRRGFGWGFATRWRHAKFIEMLLNLQSESAKNMLGLLLNKKQILRLNFESDQGIPLDMPSDFDDLISRADREFAHSSTSIQKFLQPSQTNLT